MRLIHNMPFTASENERAHLVSLLTCPHGDRARAHGAFGPPRALGGSTSHPVWLFINLVSIPSLSPLFSCMNGSARSVRIRFGRPVCACVCTPATDYRQLVFSNLVSGMRAIIDTMDQWEMCVAPDNRVSRLSISSWVEICLRDV